MLKIDVAVATRDAKTHMFMMKCERELTFFNVCGVREGKSTGKISPKTLWAGHSEYTTTV